MKDDLKLHYNGWLEKSIFSFKNHEEIFSYIKNSVTSFYLGNLEIWKQSYQGAFDHFNDDLFINFIKSNNIEEMISDLTHSEYKLGNIFLRVWLPRNKYLNWHRDTYFRGKNLTGRFPPDINIFFYPSLFKFSTPQLQVIEKSQRINFDNKILEKLQCLTSQVNQLLASNEKIYILNSAMLHGLPNIVKVFEKEKKILNKYNNLKINNINYAYPRLIVRFCSMRNLRSYRLGK